MAGMISRAITSFWKRSSAFGRRSILLRTTSEVSAQHVDREVPTPAQLAHADVQLRDMRTLFFCNSENSLTKRLRLLLQNKGVLVKVVSVESEAQMIHEKETYNPDIIICPFLTKRVPEAIWRNKDIPCLILHPGIAGDRGVSSLDWAIHDVVKDWGVTVLQASDEMDAGNIWSTQTIPNVDRTTTKTRLYNTDVSDAAMDTVIDALKRFKLNIPPTPLDYNLNGVTGTLRRNMTAQDRTIDWEMTSDEVLRKIRMSDTQPGARATISDCSTQFRLFGGHFQPDDNGHVAQYLRGVVPGTPTAQKDDAVLIPTSDGNGIWVTHLKTGKGERHLKLPAMQVLRPVLGELPYYTGPSAWRDVDVSISGDGRVAVVHFDFYNGAMNTDQCYRLKAALSSVAQDDRIEVVVLLGGKLFFSTGINLNTIEGSPNPTIESWRNINAINDVIKCLFSMRNKVTVSALQSGAGAGGVMMAASADLVWSREGTLLTPSYIAMALFGSEYWTYFLPARVGWQRAQELSESSDPILVEQAEKIGLVDDVFGRNSHEFLEMIPNRLDTLRGSPLMKEILHRKSQRGPEWYKLLERHRESELREMAKCFQSEQYDKIRRKFVRH